MAVINETLRLTDQFSAAFHAFTQMGQRSIDTTERLDQTLSQLSGQSFHSLMGEVQGVTAALQEQTEVLRRMSSAHREQERAGTRASSRIRQAFSSANDAAGNLLGTIRGLASAYLSFQALRNVVSLSDQMTSTTARLTMIVDDGGSVEALEQKIMASAQRSRASYLSTAQAISQMGLMAGDAFASNDELIAFTEAVNKQFVIAGTNAAGAEAATLQLTQAMASGVLRGEELNSVFEQAPNIIQNIADYLDVPIGQIREMASEGQITSNIVKNAMLSAADDINEAFEDMPMTWGQVITQLKNDALSIFSPLLKQINKLANSDEFQRFIRAAESGMRLLAQAIGWVIDNLSWIAPIVGGITAAWGAYKIAVGIASLATQAYTGVQWALNAAMNANPVGVVIILLVGLAAAFMIAWDACEGFRDFFVNAWAQNAKAFASFYNTVFVPIANGVYNTWMSLEEATRDFSINMVNFIAGMASGIMETFGTLMGGLRGVIEGVNLLSSLVGGPTIDYDVSFSSEGIERMRKLTVDAIEGAYESRGVDCTRNPISPVDLNKFSDFVDKTGENLKDFRFSEFFSSALESLTGAISSASSGLGATVGDLTIPLGDTNAILSGIAGDTDALRRDVSLSDESLELYRDLAQRRYMNRVELQALAPNITVNLPEGAGGSLSAKDVANEIKAMLIKQAASHTAAAH